MVHNQLEAVPAEVPPYWAEPGDTVAPWATRHFWAEPEEMSPQQAKPGGPEVRLGGPHLAQPTSF